jgi:S1-C subfamily serine protease
LFRQNVAALGSFLNAPIRMYHVLLWMLLALTFSLSHGCAHSGPPRAAPPQRVAPQSEQEIYQRVEASFVMLVIHRGGYVAQCSGAMVGYRDHRPVVLTAGHCFADDGNDITIFIDDLGAGTDEAQAELLDLDRAHDLALVRVTGPMGMSRSPLPIAAHDLQLYDHVYSMGNPSHARSVAAGGIVSALHRPSPEGGEVMQYTGFCWPGSSGGPIVNDHAEVVGVVLMVGTGNDDTIIPSLCYSATLKDIQRLAARNRISSTT